MQPPISASGQSAGSRDAAWRHAIWLALLVAASVAFTFGFACAVPFAAFGAAAAITLNPREGLVLTGAIWLANQLAGFTFLNYPWTPATFIWGAVLGLAAMLSTVAARSIASRLNARGGLAVALAAFIGAFVVYEGSLFLVSASWLGGTENFIPAIVTRIFEINAAAFAGLLLLNRVAVAVGLTSHPSPPIPLAGHHA
jgi:hypothetical protein